MDDQQFSRLNPKRFESVARLRELLFGLERDLGIDGLSQNELDILYAVRLLADVPDGITRSDALRNHCLCVRIPTPTFHRTLRSLIDKGFVARAPRTRARAYVLGPNAVSETA